MSLFLSYASHDRPHAARIRDELVQHCGVFFAAKSIAGGAEWEREIDQAIRACKVFAPIVTATSNASRWVTKETLLALEVGVPILPLLFSDSLPLRIVDRTFYRFQR